MHKAELKNRNRKMDFSYSGYCILAIAYWLFFSVDSFAGNTVSPQQKADAEKFLRNQTAQGFMENKGQMTDDKNNHVPDVLFKSELRGVDLYLTSTGLTYVFLKYTKEEEKESEKEKVEKKFLRNEVENIKTDYARVDIILKGGTIKKENIVTEYPSEEDYRYYLGHCPQGITGIRKYKKIIIREVYPGIDWVWYVNKNGVIKYDFEVHAHANPGQIQMRYKWADIKTMSDGTSLNISTPIGELTEGNAVSYNNGKTITTRYELKNNTVSFKTEKYDPNENLTIDPPLQLVWSSVYGGNDLGQAVAITCDIMGNIFMTGNTQSTTFPTQTLAGAYNQGTYGGGAYDAFILKFTANGVLVWATYYGGNSSDKGISITTDATGNIFVTGTTFSANLPTYNLAGAYNQSTTTGGGDCFILKFTNNGIRSWATYYGGSSSEDVNSICTDATGNIFVTGNTGSADLPTLNPGSPTCFYGTYKGGLDYFILKFDNNGVRSWATYYGGASNEGYLGTGASSITTDATGNIFVTGCTNSADFPVYDPLTGAYFQGTLTGISNSFILKFTNSGVLVWATYYGGNGDDWANSITTDVTGNLFVTGKTSSTNLPTLNPGASAYFKNTNSGSSDCFILKFANSGVRSWGTYYGGSGYDSGFSISTDVTGNVFVSGGTYSLNFPTLNPGSSAYFQGTCAGNIDLFFSSFTNAGIMKWSTYYGGKGCDDISAIAVNPFNCDLYFSGDGDGYLYTAITYTSFPFVAAGGGAWFQNQPGLYGIDYPIVGRFIGAAINCQSPLSVSVTATNIICNGTNNGIATATVSGGTPPYIYLWDPAGQTTPTITGLVAGSYTVTVTDANNNTVIEEVIILPGITFTISATGGGTIFAGDSLVLSTTASISYSWGPATGLNCTTCQTPIASPIATTIYCVTVTDSNGCSDSACVTVNVETKCEELFIPTAFSPNGDNNNDCFLIYGNSSCLKSFYLVVYDRWGEKVFSSNNLDTSWDGTSTSHSVEKNKKLSSGVFVYYLNAITLKGEEINKRGNISLIR